MDSLSLLRDFTVRGELSIVRLVDGVVRFGDEYRFPACTETAYRHKQGGHYTLEALLFFVKNTALKHTEYMQQARALKLQIVTFTDRKPLQDYLEGRVSTNEAIELLHSSPALALGVGTLSTSIAATDDEAPPRKRFVPEPTAGAAVAVGNNITEFPSSFQEVSKSVLELQERAVRDRESILLCPAKSFRSSLEMIGIKRDEDKRRSDQKEDKGPTGGGGGDREVHHQQQPQQQPSVPTRFAQTEEKTFWKEHLGTDAAEELGIDPTQSYIGDAINHNKHDNGTWQYVRATQRPSYHHHHHRPPSTPAHTQPHSVSGTPIILVPSASQTLLNTFNAKEFLEDGIYVSPDSKVGTMKKTDVLIIHRRIGRDQPIKYEVRDKPCTLSPKDWDRVVAVFVLGKEWQFKDWPFKDHAEIFNRSKS